MISGASRLISRHLVNSYRKYDMPLKSPKRFDPDTAFSPLVGLSEDYDAFSSKSHYHQRGQLYYCIGGTIQVEVDAGRWLVAPQRAVWIPSGVEHRSSSKQSVSLRILYIDTDKYIELPEQVEMIHVSRLLCELISEMIRHEKDWGDNSIESRLASVVIDQIISSPKERLHLPLPKDLRALNVCHALQEKPSLHVDMDRLCDSAGLSQRTLLRLLQHETKMNLQQWRQQLLILTAIEMMSNGDSITTVSMELGYASSSAFTHMFHKIMGKPPSELF